MVTPPYPRGERKNDGPADSWLVGRPRFRLPYPGGYQPREDCPSGTTSRLPLLRLHEQCAGMTFDGSNASCGNVLTSLTWSGSQASGVPGRAR